MQGALGAVLCFSSQCPAVAPDSSEVAVGLFWFLCVFSFIAHARSEFLVPFKFLCILLLEETNISFVQAQHCSTGSQVAACLGRGHFTCGPSPALRVVQSGPRGPCQ